MKNEPSGLLESLWRRKLTDAERAKLCARPEMAAECEFESRLSEILANLPDAPMPSNFTARLMQAIDSDESRQQRGWRFRWNWHAWVPRIAVPLAVALIAGLALHHYELKVQRAMLARNISFVTQSQPLPSADALNNYEVIQRMSQPGRPDEELLALMQ